MTILKQHNNLRLIENEGRYAVIILDSRASQFVSVLHNRDGLRNVGSATERGMAYAAIWQSRRAALKTYNEEIDNEVLSA